MTPDEPALAGEGVTDYERYLKVPTLLSLQKPEGELAHPDELIFQVEHQAMELWFKVVRQGLARAARHMEADEPLEAAALLARSARIVRLLADQLLILDTLPPWDYHTIRLKLGRGSGQESPGFRALLVESPKLWLPFQALLDRRKVSLVDVYTKHHDHYDAFRLAEALTDFDMHFQLWRQDHLTFIKRVIGRDVRSLKGYSVRELEQDIQMQLYPELWKVRAELTDLAGTSPEK